jgi:hypothetical protein
MSPRDRFRLAGVLFGVAGIVNLIVGNAVVGGGLLVVGAMMFVASRRYE